MKTKFLATFLISCPFLAQASVTWKEQAEQLSKVSASQLDAYPVSTPMPPRHFRWL